MGDGRGSGLSLRRRRDAERIGEEALVLRHAHHLVPQGIEVWRENARCGVMVLVIIGTTTEEDSRRWRWKLELVIIRAAADAERVGHDAGVERSGAES
jgi:hypothetical protein